jgi:hypothetical protein
MILDVKAGSLKRKARYVAGGHMAEASSAITYASVVSRESRRIGLLIAALNDLEVFAADILGEEFGAHRKGKKEIVLRTLYGLKSAVESFRNHLASCLGHVGFTSSRGNPDVWFGPAQKEMIENIMNTCLNIQMISWKLALTQRIY